MDIFKQAGLPCPIKPITITAGNALTKADDGWHVPKKELVSVMQVLLQGRRIKVAKQLPAAQVLTLEPAKLQSQDYDGSKRGFWELGAEGDHDDLVLAVALALLVW